MACRFAHIGDLPVVDDVLAVDRILEPIERRLEVLDTLCQIVDLVPARIAGRRPP
jgi:hypothetical protein